MFATSIKDIKKIHDTHSFQIGCIYIAIILSSIYFYFTRIFREVNEIFNLNYVITIFILLAFNYKKIDKFQICLFVTLLICGFLIRRWLIIWTIIALIYQIAYYQLPIIKIALIGIVCISGEIILQWLLVELGVEHNKGTFLFKTHKIAYDLGMGNSNRLGRLFWEICVYIGIIWGNDKKKILAIVSISLIMFFAFYYTSCRTAQISTILLLLGMVCRWLKGFKSIFKYIIALVPVLLVYGTIYASQNYEYMDELNEYSTGRIYYFYNYIDNFSKVDWVWGKIIETNDPLDGSFLQMILLGGIVLMVFFCLNFAISILKYYRFLIPYLPSVISILAYGMSETIFTEPSVVSIILWMVVIYNLLPKKPILALRQIEC